MDFSCRGSTHRRAVEMERDATGLVDYLVAVKQNSPAEVAVFCISERIYVPSSCSSQRIAPDENYGPCDEVHLFRFGISSSIEFIQSPVHTETEYVIETPC